MKKNILASVSFTLLLALVVILPFLLDNTFDNNNGYLTIYIVSKVVAIILLIVAFIYGIISKKANAVVVITMSTASIYQLIPLLIRFFLNSSHNPMVWSVITLIVSLIIALLILGGTVISNDKMLESDKKYQGNTIPIQDSKELYDENNQFKGLK